MFRIVYVIVVAALVAGGALAAQSKNAVPPSFRLENFSSGFNLYFTGHGKGLLPGTSLHLDVLTTEPDAGSNSSASLITWRKKAPLLA